MPKSLDSISGQSKPKAADPESKPEETTAEPPKEAEKAPEETKPEETKTEEAKAEEPKPEAEKPAEPTKEAKPEEPKAVEAATDPKGTPEGEKGEEKADSFDNLFPEPSIVMTGPPGWVWWLLLILGAAGLGFLAFSLTRSQINNWLSVNPTPTPTAAAAVSASPTITTSTSPSASSSPSPSTSPSTSPSPTNKSSITMRVLNGTTVSGAAASMESTLQKAGFTVRTIGNANNQTYTTTTIYYQSGDLSQAQAVQAAISVPTTLQESSLASPDMVLVVVGTQK